MANADKNKTCALGIAVALTICVVAAALFEYRKIAYDPTVNLLLPQGGAEWIKFPAPVNLQSRSKVDYFILFRRRFAVNESPAEAFLYVRALKGANVRVDGRVVLAPSENPDDWKKTRRADIRPLLTPGTHEMVIMVMNRDGPPAALAYCKEIGLFTGLPGQGREWEASEDGLNWSAAAPVTEIIPPEVARQFPRADEALLSRIKYLAPIFAVVFIITLLFSTGHQPAWAKRFAPGPGSVMWALLLAWAILGINDAIKIPYHVGFDSVYHLQYIRYVAERLKLPLPNEGWQMFQAPLYYMISAGFYLIFLKLFDAATIYKGLRFLPILCGAMQVALSYRALKLVFPRRGDLQALGAIIAGLIPMSLYSSQVVGNEPLAGLLTAAVIVTGIFLVRSEGPVRRLHIALIGVLLGLTLLSKMTAFLLLPPLFFLLLYVFYRGNGTARRAASGIVAVFLIGFVVSGWYYIRNWVELGRPFIGGWSPGRNFDWWQDPGYRTIGQFIGFGQCLIRPVYSGVYGVWDALYSTFWLDGFLSSVIVYGSRPPWNYNFMIGGAWLALVPSLGIILGFFRALGRPLASLKDGLLFADLFLAVYLAGIVSLYLALPIYSTGKASYTLGLIPCYALLAASGFDLMMRHPLLRATVYALISCWAVSAYAAFFAL